VSSAVPSEAESLSRIANTLALYLVREMSKGEQSALLALCGFSTKEIALLIGTSEGSVRALLSQRKRATSAGG